MSRYRPHRSNSEGCSANQLHLALCYSTPIGTCAPLQKPPLVKLPLSFNRHAENSRTESADHPCAFQSQTSPSPAKPQWGCCFLERIAIACEFPSHSEIARTSEVRRFLGPKNCCDSSPCIEISWPGPSAESCQGFLLCKFWRILPGSFLEDFSGHFCPHKTREKKSRRQNP